MKDQINTIRDAAWVLREHNLLHFGSDHNTIAEADKISAALTQLEAMVGEQKPQAEQMRERLKKAKPQFTTEQLDAAKRDTPNHLFHGKDQPQAEAVPLLSDEEINDIANRLEQQGHTLRQFARAIEARLIGSFASGQEPLGNCTNGDAWNCKYCRKTETCEALKDPRNFAAPVAQQPQEIEVQCPVCNHKFYEWPNDKQPQAEAVQACGHSMSLLLRSAESNEPLYCEACDDKSGRHDAERRETELLDANRRLQEKIGSADALKLHAIEELCQLGYTVKEGELIPPDHLHKLVEAAGHPLAAPQQAEAVPVVDRVYEAAKRLVDHADFQLGGVLSAKSKARDIPSNAASKVKARHLASLRDALAKTPQQAEAVQYTRADLDRAYSAGLVEGERLAIQQAEAVPPDWGNYRQGLRDGWAEGYEQGITDERISEANIGIAGFGAKVNPARENPYKNTAPQQAEAVSVECHEVIAGVTGNTVRPRELTEREHNVLMRAMVCSGKKVEAPQQAEAVPPDVVRDAERWRTFLATRPANTHAVINDAIDAAMAKGEKS